MKRLILFLVFIGLYVGVHAQALDTPRYTVYFDRYGIQHTSLVPTKLVAITADFNDLLIKPTTIAGYGITDAVGTAALATMLAGYTPTSRTITINGTTLDLSANRSWTISSTSPVSSVYGRTGAITASNGDYTTTQVIEGTNLYWTTARGDARYPQLASTYTNPSFIAPLIDNVLPITASTTITTANFANGKKGVLNITANCTSGNITVTLPSVASFVGYVVNVVKTDNTANIVTISGLTGDNTIGYINQSRQCIAPDATTWRNN